MNATARLPAGFIRRQKLCRRSRVALFTLFGLYEGYSLRPTDFQQGRGVQSRRVHSRARRMEYVQPFTW